MINYGFWLDQNPACSKMARAYRPSIRCPQRLAAFLLGASLTFKGWAPHQPKTIYSFVEIPNRAEDLQ